MVLPTKTLSPQGTRDADGGEPPRPLLPHLPPLEQPQEVLVAAHRQRELEAHRADAAGQDRLQDHGRHLLRDRRCPGSPVKLKKKGQKLLKSHEND